MLPFIVKRLLSRSPLRAAGFLFLALLLFVLFTYFKRYQSLEHQVATYKSVLESKVKTESFKDDSGKWHSKSSVAVVDDRKALKELAKNDSTFILLRNEIAGLKKDMRNMVNATIVTTSSTSTLHADLRDSLAKINDSLSVLYQKFEQVTPWLRQTGEIVNGKITTQTTIYDTILVSAYVRRKWFLGKAHIEVEGESRNPDTRLVVKSIIVNNKRRRRS